MIKCTTVLNTAAIKRFNYAVFPIKRFIVLILVGCILLAAGIALKYYLIVATAALIILCCLSVLLILKLSVKKSIKSNARISDDTVSVCAVSDGAIIEEVFVGGKTVQKTEICLSDLYKAIITAEYLYLFVSGSAAIVLDKKGVLFGRRRSAERYSQANFAAETVYDKKISPASVQSKARPSNDKCHNFYRKFLVIIRKPKSYAPARNRRARLWRFRGIYISRLFVWA